MVVDDHPVVRAGLVSIINLQRDMVVIAEAANGRAAVETYRLFRPDVTLMDLRLPLLNGVEAIAVLRRDYPAGRFLVLTTYDGDEDIKRALSAGALGYALKGTTGDELIDAVRHVARGVRHLPPDVEQRLGEQPPRSTLTARELDVLRLIVEGLSNREIAARLGVTEGTVKSFVNSILSKLTVRDRTQAVMTALRRGLVHV